MKNHLLLFTILIFLHSATLAQLQPLTGFGGNPGNINAYKYVPANMPSNAPLVVVIHGCTQNASGFADDTEWNELADFHKFYVVYPEQKSANNSSSCFNYWEPGDHSRGQGEAASIKQTVDYMKTQYSIDPDRVFVTGLSAGGAMTAVMLCAYPDVFAAGAEMAGLPYKVATSSLEVYTAALGLTSKSPQEWGNLARDGHSGFTGTYPRMAIFHGTSDIVINENNAEEMMKQFTNLHQTDQTADFTDNTFKGNSVVQLKRYRNSSGDVVVERYTFDNMGHGIAIDPGNCFEQGGGAGGTSFDVNFYSSYYAAKFFGLLQPPFSISGLDSITENPEGVSYSVTGNSGSNYDWEVSGGNIAAGQGTNTIAVDWVDSTGTGAVRLTETTTGGCTLGPVELEIYLSIEPEPVDTTDTTTTVIHAAFPDVEFIVFENEGRIGYTVKSPHQNIKIILHNIGGQKIFEELIQPEVSYVTEILSPGLYFLEAILETGRLVKKVAVH